MNAAIESGIAWRTIALISSRPILRTRSSILTQTIRVTVNNPLIAEHASVAEWTIARKPNAVKHLLTSSTVFAWVALTLAYLCFASQASIVRQALALIDQWVSCRHAQTIIQARVICAWVDDEFTFESSVACWAVARIVIHSADTSAAIAAWMAQARVDCVLAARICVAWRASARKLSRSGV